MAEKFWYFEQSTGKIFSPEGNYVTSAYSGGDAGKHPEGINNPAMQAIPNIGVIPEGCYTVGEPVDHTHLGPFAMPLTPDDSNEMFGRSGFYCHGDNFQMNHSASDGCIIAAKSVRSIIWDSAVHRIKVVKVFEGIDTPSTESPDVQ
jgi:hypothetical protein